MAGHSIPNLYYNGHDLSKAMDITEYFTNLTSNVAQYLSKTMKETSRVL